MHNQNQTEREYDITCGGPGLECEFELGIVARVSSFDPASPGKSRKTASKPIDAQKPNVELFDDPQHNGQYYGD